jgi:hypothetical protein
MNLKQLKTIVNAIPEEFDDVMVVIDHSELDSIDELFDVVVIPADKTVGTLYTNDLGIIDLDTYDEPLIFLINNGY